MRAQRRFHVSRFIAFARVRTLPSHIRTVDSFSSVLRSADSLAWSYRARKHPPLPGCPHARCNHCLPYALAWRARVLQAIRRGQRRRLAPTLFE